MNKITPERLTVMAVYITKCNKCKSTLKLKSLGYWCCDKCKAWTKDVTTKKAALINATI